MRRALFLPLVLGLMGLAFVALNVAAGALLPALRVDATADRLYTITQPTRTTIKALAEPITIDFYYARGAGALIPQARAHAVRVRELLATYAALSEGRIRIVEHDPAPFSTAEDAALAAGLRSIAPQETGADAPLYLGAVLRNAVDEQVVLPFLDPADEARLEFQLTRALDQLSGPRRATIAVITSLPWLFGDGGTGIARPIAAAATELEQTARVVVLAEDFDELPPDTGLILIAQPWELSPWQQWLVDQHVLRDGRAVVLADPAASTAADGGGGVIAAAGNLGPLAAAWGFQLGTDVVLDGGNPLEVEAEIDGRVMPVPQPLFFQVPPAGLSQTDPLVAGLTRGLNFGTAGEIVPVPGARMQMSVLAATSAQSSRMSAARALASPTPQEVAAGWEPEDRPLVVAAGFTGPLRSAFPQGAPPPPVRSGARLEAFGPLPPPPAAIEARAEPARIVVVADTDFLSDTLYRTGDTEAADNAAFLAGVVDQLGAGSGLSALRARTATARPLLLLEGIERRAQTRLLEERQRLGVRIDQATRRVAALEARGAAAPDGTLSPGEARELADFRAELVAARQRLRAIQQGVEADTGRVKTAVVVITSVLVPLLILLAGFLAARRGRRREQLRGSA